MTAHTGLKQSSTTAVGHTSHANYNSWLSTLWFVLVSVSYRESVKVPQGNWKLYSQKTVTNKINMENTKITRRWEEEFERVHIQLPKPLSKRIRIVLGMLVSRQSMICCNSSCIPGVWNRSSYQRGYNEWNNAKWPALRFWWLPRDQESSRKWGEGRRIIHDEEQRCDDGTFSLYHFYNLCEIFFQTRRFLSKVSACTWQGRGLDDLTGTSGIPTSRLLTGTEGGV